MKYLILAAVIFAAAPGQAQYIKSSFMGTSLIQMPSTENVGKKNMAFVISHRFGNAKNTTSDFIGLDGGANTQLALDYGVTDRLSLGFARTSAGKTYEGRTKFSIFKKGGNMPLALSFFGVAGQETEKQTIQLSPGHNVAKTGSAPLDAYINNEFNSYQLDNGDRRSYLASLLFSARFNDRLSLQLSPMFVHRNFVKSGLANDRNGVSLGGRFKLSKRFDLLFEGIFPAKRDYKGETYSQADRASYENLSTLSPDEINQIVNRPEGPAYAYLLNVYHDKPVSYYSVPLSLGLDIETGGHVFQLFITNSRDLAHTWLLRGAEYNYNKKEWTIGFNIHRYFSFEEKNNE